MERLNRANCVQEKIGSCTGCPVETAAIEELRSIARAERPIVLKKISEQACPKGNVMQMPSITTSGLW